MNTPENDPLERGITLGQLVRAAARSVGSAAPETEEETDRFCAGVPPEPVAPALVERATRAALRDTGDTSDDQTASVWQLDCEMLPEETGVAEELLALHRKEGEISPEVLQKLEEYRKAISMEQEGGSVGDEETER